MSTLAEKKANAEAILDAITAVLEGRATHDVQQYQIGGQFITKMSVNDLLVLKNYNQSELQRIKQVERVQDGKASGRLIKVEF